MIPEPFTIVATGFGIAMTLFNVAASSLEASKQRFDRFEEYDDRIQQMRAEVQLSKGELEKCLADWRDDEDRMLSLEDCAELFGEEQRQELDGHVRLILNALAKVHQTLCLGDPAAQNLDVLGPGLSARPVYNEASDWISELLNATPKNTLIVPSKQTSWKYKIQKRALQQKQLTKLIFTFWNGEAVKRTTEELRRSADGLRRFTNNLASSLPTVDSASKQSNFAERVTHLLQLNRRWRDLSSVMGTISGTPFTLLIRQPDSEGRIDCLEKDDDMTMTMLVDDRTGGDVLMNKKVVYISYLAAKAMPQHQMIENALKGHCKGTTSTLEILCPRFEGKSMRELYTFTAARLALDRSRLQRLWEMERARNALSIMTWTLLLWQTSWSECICTARLWRYPLREGHPSISMLPCLTESNLERCSFEAQIKDMNIGGHSIRPVKLGHFRPARTGAEIAASRRKMITLAVTLCEMALLCPVDIVDINHHPLQFNCGTDRGLSEKKLLDRVEKVAMKRYRAAVQLCFRYAAHPKHTITTAAEIVAFSEKLLVPFASWVSTVLEERNKPRKSMGWYTALDENILKAAEI